MNDHGSKNEGEDARQNLRRLVLEYRSIDLELVELVERVELDRCLTMISQFTVWLLDSSIETLRFDWQRELHAKIRELHVQRIYKEPVDLDLWNSLSADSLAGTKLWPPEWLCASSFPSAPPIARSAAAIALALARRGRENGRKTSQIDYSKVQADMLRSLLLQVTAAPEESEHK